MLCNYSGRLERRKSWLTTQSRLQSGEQRQTLFAQSGKVAPNATEENGSLATAKGAGNLLLKFDVTMLFSSWGMLLGSVISAITNLAI